MSRALSPTAPQVPGVTPGSPCAHGVLGTPHGEVCDMVDRFSKFAHVVPIMKTARIFINAYGRHHKLPKVIILDRDRKFISAF